jgi:fatty-acyl-CoA synthase
METLPHFLDSLAAVGGDVEALAWAPEAEVRVRLTWAELIETSRLAARRLVGLGVGKGTRVGLLCSNRIEWLPLAFGILRTGAVLVPFSTLWKRDEIAYGLNHADVALLLTLPGFRRHDYLATLGEIAPELGAAPDADLHSAAVPTLRRVFTIGDRADGWRHFEDLEPIVDDVFLACLQERLSPADLATIFFTSGTTSQAKAVVHGHGALAESARRLAPCFGVTPDDAWWGHMPLFWSGGFILGALATLAGRGRVVLHENVTPDDALTLLERERCTIMAGWHQAGPLLEHPAFDRSRIHLRKGTYHALAQRLLGPGHHAIGVYGMSETATVVTAARWDDPEEGRVGSFGTPLDGMQLRIVDPESGGEAEPGETGEILVKGPTLMEGYCKVHRSGTFDANGFFKTGDLGYLDERGALHFATRLKDVIKTAGVNVAAIEIEEALERHPAVHAAHVVGVADAVRGENIAACIVLAPDTSLDAEALRAFCKESLAAYKVPRHVLFLEEAEVPRTGSGKVAKAALREFAARLIGERIVEGEA